MLTLGINAAFHDCAAALVDDGRVVAASEEERFTRVKHGKRPLPFTTWQLPFHAIDDCLAQRGATLADVDRVAYSFDPSLLDGGSGAALGHPLPEATADAMARDDAWNPLFAASIAHAPRQLVDGAPHHLRRRFDGVDHESMARRWSFVEHHRAHEASAFLAAPFDDCAVLVADGRGEVATTSLGWFDGDRYERLRQIDLPHSLGLLYEDVTRWLGFLHSSDEYKVMALASYGKRRYAKEFAEILVATDGAYRLEPARLVERFGPARVPGGEFEQRHHDVARSLQDALEDTLLELGTWLYAQTASQRLAMAGGVALNCVANARLRDAGPFSAVWVQPAAGDAGTALGAALWTDRLGRGRQAARWTMDHACLGPSFGDDEIEALLRSSGVAYRRPADIAAATAARLSRNRVVGWFQGRMEFGPRALGARSILASPIDPAMQSRLNGIKDREDFRPVAPMVVEEKAHEWFRDGAGDGGRIHAPFMLFVYDVRPDKAARIPSVRHVDGTARVQTVSAAQNPLVHRMLRSFDAATGVPIVVNTSFNTRGRPIVCTPRDALEAFFTSPLDALAIGSFIVDKSAP